MSHLSKPVIYSVPGSPCCGVRWVPTAPLQPQPVPGRWVRPQGLVPAAGPYRSTGDADMALFFLLTLHCASYSLFRNSKQMPAAVAEALQLVLQLEGGLSPSEAEEHLAALERSQRFQSETWS